LFLNGYIANFNADFGSTTRSQYRICDPNAKFPGDPVTEPFSTRRFCIDTKRIPLPLNSSTGEPTLAYPLTTLGLLQWGLVQSTKLGAEPKRLKAYSDWIDKIWPAN